MLSYECMGCNAKSRSAVLRIEESNSRHFCKKACERSNIPRITRIGQEMQICVVTLVPNQIRGKMAKKITKNWGDIDFGTHSTVRS
jgi:hypothetical protein